MKTKTLTSKDNIEKELTDFLNEGCIIKADRNRLRINFINDEICISVRLESLKGLSQEFKDKLPCSRYIQFINNKNGKMESIDVDHIRYLATIPKSHI